jgi:hypothetical protein
MNAWCVTNVAPVRPTCANSSRCKLRLDPPFRTPNCASREQRPHGGCSMSAKSQSTDSSKRRVPGRQTTQRNCAAGSPRPEGDLHAQDEQHEEENGKRSLAKAAGSESLTARTQSQAGCAWPRRAARSSASAFRHRAAAEGPAVTSTTTTRCSTVGSTWCATAPWFYNL